MDFVYGVVLEFVVFYGDGCCVVVGVDFVD